MSLDFENYNSQDTEIIKKQIKSDDVFISGIYKRCIYGFPQVVFLHPVKEFEDKKQLNYEVISNIIWLTCPYLNDKIHELEDSSYIDKIETLIQNNCSFYDMMQRAHAEYYFLRNIIFRRYADSLIKQEGIDLSQRGIGGIKNLKSVKCLHLHFCHFCICKDNLAGRITYHLLGEKTACDENICSKL